MGTPFLSHEYNCLLGQSVVAYTLMPPLGTAPYSFTLLSFSGTFSSTAVVSGTTGTLTAIPIGHYSVFLQAANNCTSLGIYQVNVPPSVMSSVFSKTTSCFGQNNGKVYVQPPTSFTPAFTFTWQPGGGNSQLATNLAPNVVYTVTVGDQKGCNVSNTVMVTEDPEIHTNFVDSFIGCFGKEINTSLTSTGGTLSPYSYTFNGTPLTGAAVASVIAGPHNVITKDGKGCIKQAVIHMKQAAQNIITPTIDPPSCFESANGSLSVTVNGDFPGYTYTWQPISSSTSGISDIPDGSYTVTVKDATACITVSVFAVNAPPQLIAPVPLIQKENCSAADGAFTLSANGGTAPYNFLTVPGNITSTIVTNLSTGSYTGIVTDSNGCIDSVVFWLGNLSTVTLNATVTNTIKCHGACQGAVQLNPVNAVSPVTYTTFGSHTTSGNTMSGLCAGGHVIKVIDAIGCPAFDTVFFSAPPALSYSATTPPTSCYGKDVVLIGTASGGTGSHDFIWTPGGIHGQSVTIMADETKTYSLNVVDGNGCTLEPFQFTVNVLPKISISVGDAETGICPGTTAQITPTVTGGDGNYTYTWMPGNSSSAFMYVENIQTPTYSLIVKDACGSPPVVKEIKLRLFPVTQPKYVTVGDSGCVPYCTKFINITPKSTNAVWNYGDGPFEQKGDTTNYCYKRAGKYNLRLTVTDSNSCRFSKTYFNAIDVLGKPDANFKTTPSVITLHDAYQVEIKNMSGNANSYRWHINSKLYSTEKEISFPFSDTGCYDFRLVALNDHCIDSTDRSICVFEGFTFYMPSAFSPNNDNLNEVLKPKGTGWLYTNYLFEVYNRWGFKVFTSNDVYEGWDGGLKVDPYDVGNGTAHMNDTYVWRVVVTDNLGKEHVFRGSVLVLR